MKYFGNIADIGMLVAMSKNDSAMIWSNNTDDKIFKDPHIDLSRENRLPSLFAKIKSSGDNRSRLILVNLILESLTDALLAHLIKRYSHFAKETNPSFHSKLSLLRAFNLIPDQVILSINCLREIRNRFAHKLDVTSFNDLDEKIIKTIDQTISAASIDQENELRTVEDKIYKIEFYAIVGLDIYEPNLRLMGEKINSKEFKDYLDSEYKRRINEQLSILKRGKSMGWR